MHAITLVIMEAAIEATKTVVQVMASATEAGAGTIPRSTPISMGPN